MFVTKYHSIVVKEGKHKINFYFDAHNMTSASLYFKEAHKYLFDFYIDSTKRKINFWIYDITEKKVVWGKKDERVKY